MNGARLMLEQFEITTAERTALIDPDIVTETDQIQPSARLGADLDIAPEDGAMALMDDPPIRRAPEEDQVPDEAELRTAELAQACDLLASLTATIEAERASGLDTAIRSAADCVAGVGGALLSSIIDRAFAAEIAQAIVDLAARIPHDAAELHVAADDHDQLTAAIATHAPGMAITLIADADLASGQARMTWPDGGADFDAAGLTDRIAPLIAERLNGLNIRSMT